MLPSTGTSISVTLGSTMAQSSGKSYAVARNVPLAQTFRARATGIPTELAVRMGSNQVAYGARLRIFRSDQLVFDRMYAGRVQRPSDWTTVFALDGIPAFHAGDVVRFEITTDRDTSMEPILSTDPDVTAFDLPGYGKVAFRFQMLGVPSGPPAAAGRRVMLTAAIAPPARGQGPVVQEVKCIASISGPASIDLHAGEPCTVTITPDAETEVLQTTWTLSGGNPIRSYTSSNTDALVTPLVLNARTVEMEHTLVFPAPGDFTLTIRCRSWVNCPGGVSDEQTYQASTVLKVRAPSLATCLTKTGEPMLDAQSGDPRFNIRFGSQSGFDKGFNVRTHTTAPNDLLGGKLRDVQLINSVRTIDSARIHSGGWVLDTVLPYSARGTFRKSPRFWFANDTPEQPFLPKRNSVSVDEHFRFYLQWLSPRPNSFWVTICRIDWSWNVVVQKVQGTHVITSSSYTNSSLPGHASALLPAENRELPEWTDNIRDVTDRGGPRVTSREPVPQETFFPEPTTGPFDPIERRPTSRPDIRALQQGRRQMIFDFWARRDPTQPIQQRVEPPMSREEAGELIDSRLGPDAFYNGHRYVITWAVPDDVAANFERAEEWPLSERIKDLDLERVPKENPNTLYIFRFAVAPFCWGDDAYWETRAHAPTVLDGVGETDDFSRQGYETALRALAQAASTPVVRAAWVNDRKELEIDFRGMPALDLMQAIAAMPQTNLVKRIRNAARIDDPHLS